MSVVLHPFSLLPAWQLGPGLMVEHPHTGHPPSTPVGSKLGPCNPTEILFSPSFCLQ